MYPFKVTLVSFREDESSEVRRALANLVVDVEGEFATADKALEDQKRLLAAKCILLVRVSSVEDLNQVKRLLRAMPGKPILAVLNANVDVQALLSTQRAGAAQAVLCPIQAEDLQGARWTLWRCNLGKARSAPG